MHIVIAGGYEQTDFLIENLKENGHKLTVINAHKEYCEKLSAHHDLPVFHGDPTRFYVLNEAGIEGADVLVSLSERDENNLAVCQFAKKCFHIPHTVCTVRNPKNVQLPAPSLVHAHEPPALTLRFLLWQYMADWK